MINFVLFVNCVRRYQLIFCGLLNCKGTVVFAHVMVLVVFFSHGQTLSDGDGWQEARWHCQVALTVGGASVCVVTYAVVAVWFCQCFAPSSDRSDDDLLVSLSRGLLPAMTQFGYWVIYG